MKNLDELKNLLRAGVRLVCNKVGVIANKKECKEPYWKRRIEDGIARLRKDLSQIDDWFKGQWKNIKHRRKDELRRKYSSKENGFKTLTEELKQRVTAKAGKLKRYKARYGQNKLFRCNQKALYEELSVVNAGKLVIHHMQTMLRHFGVRYEINFFSIRKMLSGWLRSERNWK